jgi:hypothetical protein
VMGPAAGYTAGIFQKNPRATARDNPTDETAIAATVVSRKRLPARPFTKTPRAGKARSSHRYSEIMRITLSSL